MGLKPSRFESFLVLHLQLLTVLIAMQLRYYLNENGKRVYTLEAGIKGDGEEDEKPTFSAHPARFSPDDKYSEQRIKCKRRFGELRTQKKAPDMLLPGSAYLLCFLYA